MKANNKNRKLQQIRLKNAITKACLNDETIEKFRVLMNKNTPTVYLQPSQSIEYINVLIGTRGGV
jgi:LPS O-antigen subunit length determinant protein (WzzB/FepE family)